MYRALGKRVPHYRKTKSALEMILTRLHYYNVRLRHGLDVKNVSCIREMGTTS
jgi:hypothetical protein